MHSVIAWLVEEIKDSQIPLFCRETPWAPLLKIVIDHPDAAINREQIRINKNTSPERTLDKHINIGHIKFRAVQDLMIPAEKLSKHMNTFEHAQTWKPVHKCIHINSQTQTEHLFPSSCFWSSGGLLVLLSQREFIQSLIYEAAARCHNNASVLFSRRSFRFLGYE